MEIQTSEPLSIQIPSVVTVKQNKDQPASLLVTRPDVLWPQVCKESVGYFVGRGITSYSTCRGCRRIFTQNELRVKTKLVLEVPEHRVADVSFCASLACITKGSKKYSAKVRRSESIESLSHVVAVGVGLPSKPTSAATT
jgi:hypothetical protein